MKRWFIPFNIYLVLAACLCATTGCKSNGSKKKLGKEAAALRFHLQTAWNRADRTETISVFRSNPMTLKVDTIASLDEGHIAKAEVVDDAFGGFAIRITFNRPGTWLLENLTTANKGGRFAIVCISDDVRWIAAPYIDRRYGEGVYTFTPDATREEAEKIVKGLNNVVARLNMKDF